MGLGSARLDAEYDRWLTTPPEYDFVCTCDECGLELCDGEKAYRLDDGVYCTDCAKEWLENFAFTVQEDI